MDSGAIANILRRPVTPAENPALERITLSVRLAIAVAAAHGGRAELARELQALAGRYPLVRLVQAPNAPARLEAGPFRWPIAAALRDALLAAVRTPTTTSPATQGPAVAVPGAATSDTAASRPAAGSTLTVAIHHLQAQGAAGALHAGTIADTAASMAAARPPPGVDAIHDERPAATPAHSLKAASPAEVVALAAASQRAAAQWPAISMPGPPPTPKEGAAAADAPVHRLALPLSAPLLDEVPDATAAAARLIEALRGSGVFSEAQLARAMTRPAGDVAAEAAALRKLGNLPAELTLGERTAAQLEVLRRDAAAFVLTSWTGQKASLDIGRERIDANNRGAAGADAAGQVYFAMLHLDLPRLGVVTIRLRLLHSSVAAAVEAADPGPWRTGLPDLAAQLGARGLQTAALAASPMRRNEIDAGA